MAYYWIVIILLIGADQGIKYYVSTSITLGATHELIPGLLSLTSLRNDGAAWSILSGKMNVFYVITAVAVVVLLYAMWRLRHQRLYMWGISFMLAGTIGNFIDRIRLGYVVDMFQFDFVKNFPISNFADWCLTIGVVLLIIAVIFDRDDQPSTKKGPRHAARMRKG
ncbi:signal peptidase II [Furfurilactobacillus siliginis]|uniref:Lipoprotein signal peptidase n=1 Tax=Furfurilactobacillus siliginis TaxID=348151 RepID=A0A0R2L5N8_9LACO|nr:signal peptidase II [Furfurilactobacillus siliginis]KRN96963.1 lipoprotein signal peptidase [Furfurilactobacillus siliginis]GEK27722.1 lipoprotein signal peptidase [Furfurilactobacillus siliginis]